jgi:hypothetical protein
MPRRTWEYHVQYLDPGEEAMRSWLYDLGLQGWELVTVNRTNTNDQRFIFKRPSKEDYHDI